jgi:outer membrane biosynthesis protein TonB
MQRATLRYVFIGLAVVLGMSLAGFAVASTFQEPGTSDLGPSIVFTPSPAASEPRKAAPDKGAEPKPAPTEPSAPPKPEPEPEPEPDKTAVPPPAPAPVPVQPAPPVEYDDDFDDDDDAAEPDEDDNGIDD